jgi:hypothetical protein
MPYRPLDLEGASKHRSAWVVPPNGSTTRSWAPRNTLGTSMPRSLASTRSGQCASPDGPRTDAGSEPDSERVDPTRPTGPDRERVFLAPAFSRGPRPDHPGLDRTQSLCFRRRPFHPAIFEPLTSAVPDTAPSGVDPVARLKRDRRVGFAPRS